jgi:hypothetical protein
MGQTVSAKDHLHVGYDCTAEEGPTVLHEGTNK